MIGGDASYDQAGGEPVQDTPWQPPHAQDLPSSPGQPPPEPTGDERVDAALSRLDELAAKPVADHVEVFEDLQRRLQDVLASVDHDERPDSAERAEQAAPAARPGPPRWGS